MTLENPETKEVKEEPILRIDFSFFKIKGEFLYLRMSFDKLKEQVVAIIAAEEKKMQQQIKPVHEAIAAMKEHDEEEYALLSSERHMYENMYDDFLRVELPRFFYGPFISILYAICEAAIFEIADYGQKKKMCQLGIRDLGGGVRKQAETYFEKVLEAKLFPNNEHSKMFRHLTYLRHAIAHANGRIDMLTDRQSIDKIIDLDIGVLNEDGYLIITKYFLDVSIDTMRVAMEDLMGRIKMIKPEKR